MPMLRHYISRPVILVCSLIALLLSIACSVDGTGTVHWSQGLTTAFPMSVIIILLFAGVRLLLVRYGSCLLAAPAEIPLQSDEFHYRVDTQLVFRRAGILLLFWIPYAIFLYPGVLTFDTSFQLCQFFGNEMPGIFPTPEGYAFTDHHPLMTTLLFGSIVRLGELFGSYNFGFFILCLLVGVLNALSVAFCLIALERHGVSRKLTLASLIFFALFPVFPYMAMTPSKDSIFAPLFLLFTVMIFEIVLSGGRCLKSRRFYAAFILLAWLVPLSKKTGVYIVLLCCVGLAIFCRNNKSRLLVTGFTSFVVSSFLVPMTLFPLLNVSSGSKVEMLGPLYQQTARYVFQYDGEIEQADQDAIDAVLGYDSLADRYNYSIVDTVIHAYDEVDLTPGISDLLRYFKSYIALGLKHPLAYVDAFVSLEKGWFDPRERLLFAEGNGLLLEPPNGRPAIQRSAMGQKIATIPGRIISIFQQVPGFDLLFTPLFYTALIPGLCGSMLFDAEKRLIMLPLLVSALFLLLSPVSLCSQNIEAMRYLLPFIYLAPIYLCFSTASFVNCNNGKDWECDWL